MLWGETLHTFWQAWITDADRKASRVVKTLTKKQQISDGRGLLAIAP
jgi:hypothetical protein